MLGALLTLLVCFFLAVAGHRGLSRLTDRLDPAERWGISGMLALGALGWLTFFLGMIPGGLKLGFGVLGFAVLVGIASAFPFKKLELEIALPSGTRLLFPLVVGLLCLLPLVSVLAPSDMLDWDSLAYHLAVPKVWLNAGQIQFLPYDHHSNFPLVVDNLFIWGETWGGQQGAKAFSWAYLIFGLLAIFGAARRWYGRDSGWWAALAFAGIPLVLWESGTAYIDVAHGLFAGLALMYCAEFVRSRSRSDVILIALLLGFAAGSKYTGLQVVAAVAIVLTIACILNRKIGDEGLALRPATLSAIVGISMVIASPWYIRNIVNLGNPVYPFLYEQLGGRNWDQWRADLYRDEQQSFGIGRLPTGRDKLAVGAAILGLGYQPGRYINPQQDEGGGLPLGATGIVILAAAVLWASSGLMASREKSVLAMVGLSLAMWFFLSQQSRYILSLAPPLAVMAGGAIVALGLGRLLSVLTAAQAIYSGWLLKTTCTDDQLQVVAGKVTEDEFLSQRVPFYSVSKVINGAAKGGKVALYDEVFGYFLDVPYFWANPGHSTMIPYEAMGDGDAYVTEMKRQGFTHIYLNLMLQPKADRDRWLQAAGLAEPARAFDSGEIENMSGDLNRKWRVLVAQAIAAGKLKLIDSTKGGLLFEIAQ